MDCEKKKKDDADRIYNEIMEYLEKCPYPIMSALDNGEIYSAAYEIASSNLDDAMDSKMELERERKHDEEN